MKIPETIKKAIEGGYDNQNARYIALGLESQTHCNYSDIFLDPLFWQCIGKAMEWGGDTFHEDDGKTYWDYYFHCPICGEIITDLESGCPSECEYDCAEIISWLYEWQKFIAHLADGGIAEEFFKELK